MSIGDDYLEVLEMRVPGVSDFAADLASDLSGVARGCLTFEDAHSRLMRRIGYASDRYPSMPPMVLFSTMLLAVWAERMQYREYSALDEKLRSPTTSH